MIEPVYATGYTYTGSEVVVFEGTRVLVRLRARLRPDAAPRPVRDFP